MYNILRKLIALPIFTNTYIVIHYCTSRHMKEQHISVTKISLLSGTWQFLHHGSFGSWSARAAGIARRSALRGRFLHTARTSCVRDRRIDSNSSSHVRHIRYMAEC